MTAKQTWPQLIWRYQGWCEVCQDGLNSNSRTEVADWITTHNRTKHPTGRHQS